MNPLADIQEADEPFASLTKIANSHAELAKFKTFARTAPMGIRRI